MTYGYDITDIAVILTAVFLFLGLMFDFTYRRKRLKLTFGDYPPYKGFWIVVTNTSATRNISIKKYGVKLRSSDSLIQYTHKPTIYGEQLIPQAQVELPFYDSKKGHHLDIDQEDIRYVYVIDSAGRIYREYPEPRLLNRLRDFF